MRKIYILSTYTGTILSYLIKATTGVPYPHVSIALDKRLGEVYSFGRIHYSNPIIAGFVREYIDGGLYGRKQGTLCRVYALEVTDIEYTNLLKELEVFVSNPKKYKYDASALIDFLCKKPRVKEDRYVCSQFVAYLLEKVGLNLFEKEYSEITPMDFYQLDKVGEVEYEGLLCDYREK